MRALLLAAALIGAPAAAQVGATTPPAIAPPAPPPAAPVEPARLAAATALIGQVLPSGAFRRVMAATTGQLTGQMSRQMLDTSMAQFARIGGASEADVARMQPASLREAMSILDPAFERRMTVTMQVMTEGMIDVMAALEPDMRAGMAEAYARRFTLDQLRELSRFFATPTGAAYAGQSLTLMSDPAIASRMQAIMSRVMAALPDLARKAGAATADLPKPRRYEDLSTADKQRLQALFGTSAQGK